MAYRAHECIICRQNDPRDGCYPIDVIAENALWILHHARGRAANL
jgi:hypothetical protein